jgi:hypothetical protein
MSFKEPFKRTYEISFDWYFDVAALKCDSTPNAS